MLKWFRRVLIGLVAVVALLLAAGYGYESISAWSDARRFDPPGAMVDVGGYRLNISCIGDALGPTVLIEAGGGVGAVGYVAVQEQIAQFARVCIYDRAGLGWSEPAPTPRTFDEMARELNAYAAIPEEQRRPGGFGTLDDLPVAVVVRGRADMDGGVEFEQEWREAHRRLSELSSNSILIVAERSGHIVHVEEPDAYVNAVRRVVVAAREHSRIADAE
jgi:pimeloyl-ACP methyl ester carboxylesterase